MVEQSQAPYVLDTSSIKVFENYYPSRFPAFWEELKECVDEGRILSVREVFLELDLLSTKPHLDEWAKNNKRIFRPPTKKEAAFVGRIFEIQHFQQLVSQRAMAIGRPVADPFVIASAHERKACVITEETYRANAGKIPNVCKHFGIDCIDLETFMEREGWSF